MTKQFLAVLILGLIPCPVQAQSSDFSKWYGYGYVAPGGRVTTADGSRATLHIGSGIERYSDRHFGVGGDTGFAGRMAPEEKFFSGWGTVSSNLVARFPAQNKKTRAEAFVTAGYTRISRVGRNDHNGMNFGLGFNWWLDKRAALRIEVRDHMDSLFSQGSLVHFVGLRIGLTFR